jgi:hypothetical protein
MHGVSLRPNLFDLGLGYVERERVCERERERGGGGVRQREKSFRISARAGGGGAGSGSTARSQSLCCGGVWEGGSRREIVDKGELSMCYVIRCSIRGT